MEYTFSMLKPDATIRNITGKVISYMENCGLKIVAQKMLRLTKEQAQNFYIVHKGRPFYNSLIEYMISGPVIVQVLYGEDAVRKYREIMGATNPVEALEGTIRKDFAETIERNTVHGSDSLENAKKEIEFFFSLSEYIFVS